MEFRCRPWQLGSSLPEAQLRHAEDPTTEKVPFKHETQLKWQMMRTVETEWKGKEWSIGIGEYIDGSWRGVLVGSFTLIVL